MRLQRQLVHEGLLSVVLLKARSGQFWTDAEILIESFDFPDGKHLSVASLLALNYWRLLQFYHLCIDNLQSHIFLKGINHWLFVFFLPMFILKMHSVLQGISPNLKYWPHPFLPAPLHPKKKSKSVDPPSPPPKHFWINWLLPLKCTLAQKTKKQRLIF